MLLAQHVWSSWGIGEIVIAIIVVAAILGILFVALKEFGIVIPPWVWRIIAIVFCAALCILAVRFLLSL